MRRMCTESSESTSARHLPYGVAEASDMDSLRGRSVPALLATLGKVVLLKPFKRSAVEEVLLALLLRGTEDTVRLAIARELTKNRNTLYALHAEDTPSLHKLCVLLLKDVSTDTPGEHVESVIKIIRGVRNPPDSLKYVFHTKLPLLVANVISHSNNLPLAILFFLKALDLYKYDLTPSFSNECRKLLEAFVSCSPQAESIFMYQSLYPATVCFHVSSLLVFLQASDPTFLRIYERVVLVVLQNLPPLWSLQLGGIVYGLCFYGHGSSVIHFLASRHHVLFNHDSVNGSIGFIRSNIFLAWSYVAVGLLPPQPLLSMISKFILNVRVDPSQFILHLDQLQPFLAPNLPAGNWRALVEPDMMQKEREVLAELQLVSPFGMARVESGGTQVAFASLISVTDGGRKAFVPWPVHPSTLTPEMASRLGGIPVALLLPPRSNFLQDKDGAVSDVSQVVHCCVHQLMLCGWRVTTYYIQDEGRTVRSHVDDCVQLLKEVATDS